MPRQLALDTGEEVLQLLVLTCVLFQSPVLLLVYGLCREMIGGGVGGVITSALSGPITFSFR